MIYTNKKKIERYKTILLYSIPVLLLILIVSVLLGISNKTAEVAENKAATLDTKGDAVKVFITGRDIQAGENVDASMLEITTVPKELATDGCLTSVAELKEKRLSVPLTKGELIMKDHLVDVNSWYEDGDRLIEQSFSSEAIPATIQIGSLVDIKLFKDNSWDEVVVSKAVVVGKVDNTLSFYLNEAEQENLKEAPTEGSVFLVQYIVNTQPASSVTYKASYDKQGIVSGNSEGEFANSNMDKEN